MDQQQQAKTRNNIQSTESESTRAKLRRRLKGQVIRGRLWAPFGRRMLLKGICVDGGAVVREPVEVLQLLGQHWGAVFGERK
eukprot:3035869-Pyramimonas_sp.AAC.1